MTKHDATLRNLENQMGALLSDIENLRSVDKEHCKAVTLKNRKMLKHKVVELEDKSIVAQNEEEDQPNVKILILQKLVSTAAKEKQEVQIKKLLDVLKQLYISTPLVEALEQISNYVKLMKDILSKKKRFREFEALTLTK
ncbi:Transposon Ty3-I Gag-Pol polyprotein [Gossypium australe]|uniref:Transposon Ty3-I Gag-Pol polyprotein n=1 Tax=Gossypium australe TaxID=47621 RepID=A0A5B6VLP0_9ROSI|nr:Transposon Ty3-I Gag-Pol polyprotein [Gossypium australe]